MSEHDHVESHADRYARAEAAQAVSGDAPPATLPELAAIEAARAAGLIGDSPVSTRLLKKANPLVSARPSPVEAWERLTGKSAGLATVTPLHPDRWTDQEHRVHVFRLDRVAGVDRPVVAVRCSTARADLESRIYGLLLPRIGLSSLRFYGSVREQDGDKAWEFIDYVDTEAFSPTSPTHRRSLADLLGSMHARGPMLDPDLLPERGGGVHRAELGVARVALESFRKSLPNGSPDAGVVEMVLDRMQSLDRRWKVVQDELSAMPSSLVHADLKPKNLGILRTGDREDVLPFDWEYAGWGPIAVDLGAALVHRDQADVYLARIREIWPTVTRAELGRMGGGGRRTARCDDAPLGKCWRRVVADAKDQPWAGLRRRAVEKGGGAVAVTPLDAWEAIASTGAAVASVEVLQERKGKPGVWRLCLARGLAPAVVMKRADSDQVRLERFVYQELLAPAGLGGPQCLGSVPDDDTRFAWLAVEDVGGEPYDNGEPANRELASEWLGRLHRELRESSAATELPQVGADHYRKMIQQMAGMVPAILSNRALAPDEADEVRGLAAALGELKGSWPFVEAIYSRFEPTLVHGSFSRRNMRVVAARSGRSLRVFDWGAAGCGVPARDLAKLVSSGIGGSLDTYDPGRAGDLCGLVEIGRLFRTIEHLRWTVPRLAYGWVDGPIATVHRHHRELRTLVCALQTSSDLDQQEARQ